MTYPLKFRQHILAVREKESLTFAETAVRFNISMSSLMRWHKNLHPVMKRNKPATKISSEALMKDVMDWPDAYLYERAQRLRVSTTGIIHAMKRLKITHKKNTRSPPGRRRNQTGVSEADSGA